MTSPKSYYKCYYHDSSKNETLNAIKAAYALGDRPMLLFIGNPKSPKYADYWNNLTTAKFKKYLVSNQMVCLKIEDSVKHFKNLVKEAKSFANLDGSQPNGLLVLIKPRIILVPSDTVISFNFNEPVGYCKAFICGSTDESIPCIDDESVIEWLENAKELDEFKNMFSPIEPVQDGSMQIVRKSEEWRIPCSVTVSFSIESDGTISETEAEKKARQQVECLRRIMDDALRLAGIVGKAEINVGNHNGE